MACYECIAKKSGRRGKAKLKIEKKKLVIMDLCDISVSTDLGELCRVGVCPQGAVAGAIAQHRARWLAYPKHESLCFLRQKLREVQIASADTGLNDCKLSTSRAKQHLRRGPRVVSAPKGSSPTLSSYVSTPRACMHISYTSREQPALAHMSTALP